MRPPVLTVADYYWHHLDRRTPIVVVSDQLAGCRDHAGLSHALSQLHLSGAATPLNAQGGGSVSDSASLTSSSAYSCSVLSGSSGGAHSTLSGSSGGTAAAAVTPAAPQSGARAPPHVAHQLATEGVVIVSAAELFLGWWAHVPAVAELADSLITARMARLEAGGDGAHLSGGGALYAAHLSALELEEGLAAGQLLQVCVCVCVRAHLNV